jgi:hypothetical protein
MFIGHTIGILLPGDSCTVLQTGINQRYQGDCRNGKAQGVGKAWGDDYYEGEFKAGYANGTGKYIWKNGDKYEGMFVMGKREGRGRMQYNNATDSVRDGFWKNDDFRGAWEKPWILYSKSLHVTSASVKKLSGATKQVDLFLESVSGGTRSFSSGEIPKPVLNDIQVVNGAYQRITANTSLGKKTEYTLEDVTFPLRLLLTVGSDVVEVEFFEPARWSLSLSLAQ